MMATFRYQNRHHPSPLAVGTERNGLAVWTALDVDYQPLGHTTIVP
jgi:hypothetical protein